MGAAIPWRYYYKWYGGKPNQIQAVADSIAGTSRCIIGEEGVDQSIDWEVTNEEDCKKKGTWAIPEACFLAQPIHLTDSEVQTLLSGYPNPKSTQMDAVKSLVRKPSIGAGDTYLIIPFEGCGGDGSAKEKIPDVANSCFNSLTRGDLINALNGTFTKIDGAKHPHCGGLLALWDRGAWGWNENVYNNFQLYSAPLGLDGYKTPSSGHLNWCSGANMHFDIGMDQPLWMTNSSNGTITETNAPSNIFMRFKRHRCTTPNGDAIDVKAPHQIGAYVQCPKPYWSGSSTCDNEGCGNSTCMCEVGEGNARHGCCTSDPKAVKPDTVKTCGS